MEKSENATSVWAKVRKDTYQTVNISYLWREGEWRGKHTFYIYIIVSK